MKKYYIKPDMPDMFFYKGYEIEHPEIYQNALNYSFQEIFGKIFLGNGLLRIRSWISDQILGEWGRYFVSSTLKEKLIKNRFLEEDRFIPVAYGWVKDPDTEPVPLPDFYLLNLDGKTNNDPIYLNKDEDLIEKLFVNEDILNVILSLDNEWLKHEEIYNT